MMGDSVPGPVRERLGSRTRALADHVAPAAGLRSACGRAVASTSLFPIPVPPVVPPGDLRPSSVAHTARQRAAASRERRVREAVITLNDLARPMRAGSAPLAPPPTVCDAAQQSVVRRVRRRTQVYGARPPSLTAEAALWSLLKCHDFYSIEPTTVRPFVYEKLRVLR